MPFPNTFLFPILQFCSFRIPVQPAKWFTSVCESTYIPSFSHFYSHTLSRWQLWLILCVGLTGLRVVKILIKNNFWVCPWGCFWKRLAFEFAYCVEKVTLASVGRHHPVHRGPGLNREAEEVPGCSLCVSWNTHLTGPWTWVSWFLDFWTQTGAFTVTPPAHPRLANSQP